MNELLIILIMLVVWQTIRQRKRIWFYMNFWGSMWSDYIKGIKRK